MRRAARWPAALLAAGLAVAAAAQETRTFRGAWFSIDYPADFEVRPSLRSTTADGYDSAIFAAPDGRVAFYVHAPQWGGVPVDIALDPATERLAGERVVEDGPVTRRWFTIAARDGSYARSYLTVTDDRGPTSTTIGLRYASPEVLDAFRDAYASFRRSLQQYAD